MEKSLFSHRRRHGFTLLEVALIVAIIGMMMLIIIGYVIAPKARKSPHTPASTPKMVHSPGSAEPAMSPSSSTAPAASAEAAPAPAPPSLPPALH